MKTDLLAEGDKLIVANTADVEAVIEATTRLHNDGQHGSSEMRHAASFPQVIVETYLHTAGITLHEFMTNPVHVTRMLQDPDLSKFRVWKGRC
jgi:hypothetical protein